MSRIRHWAPACAGVTLALLALCAFGQTAGTPKEREVTWYTAMNTQDAEPLRVRFEERYPGVRLTILRQPGEKIRNRILAEAQAGKHLWDVVSFNHLDMGTLERERLLAGREAPRRRRLPSRARAHPGNGRGEEGGRAGRLGAHARSHRHLAQHDRDFGAGAASGRRAAPHGLRALARGPGDPARPRPHAGDGRRGTAVEDPLRERVPVARLRPLRKRIPRSFHEEP